MFLTRTEIEIINLLAIFELVNESTITDKESLAVLIKQGLVEKVHQEVASINRYRLTQAGWGIHSQIPRNR